MIVSIIAEVIVLEMLLRWSLYLLAIKDQQHWVGIAYYLENTMYKSHPFSTRDGEGEGNRS